MHRFHARMRFCERDDETGAQLGLGIRARAMSVAIWTAVAVTVLCQSGSVASGALPVTGTSPPDLLDELLLPHQAALPTCATSVDGHPGAVASSVKGELVVGQAGGAITIFQYDPLTQKTLSFPVQLRLERGVDDVCSIRVPGGSIAPEEILTLALQGSMVTLLSHTSMKPIAEAPLPEPSGFYSLVVVGETQTAFVHDGRALRELVVEPRGRGWGLSVRTVIDGRSSGFRVAVLPDRLLVIGDGSITEILGHDSISTVLPGSVSAMRASAYCATSALAVLGHDEANGGRLTLLTKDPSGWRVGVGVSLPGSVNAAVAMSNTTVVVGGGCRAAWGGMVGWLAVISDSGDTLAQAQHPVPVALLGRMDDYVVAHGPNGNLSVYDEQLRPIWDHASMVEPVALLARDFDGSGSIDLAVVGVATHRRRRWEVDSMRVYLDREDIFGSAELVGVMDDGTGGRYVKREGSATLFLSNRNVLLDVLETNRDAAVLSLARGRAKDAQSAAMRARAAAAVLGRRSSVRDASGLLAESRSLPHRTRLVLVLSIGLLVAGVYVAARRARGELAMPVTLVALTILLFLGVAGRYGLGSTRWSRLLFLGGAVPAVGCLVSLGRRRITYAAIAPGAPIEELTARIMGFIHGGQGDFEARDASRVSDDARKNITQLAYLAREMLHNLENPERYEALRRVLAKSVVTFRDLVLPETRYLAGLGREMGFAVGLLETMECAASDIMGALDAILGEGRRSSADAFGHHLQAIQDGRRRLVEAAEAVRDAVVANPGCSLTSALDDLVALRRDLLSAQGVVLAFSSSVSRRRDAVRGSRYVIFTIFENLLSNAVRAMDESSEKTLAVSAGSDGIVCRVVISDTGKGMSAEQLGVAFVEREGASSGGFGLPYSQRVLRKLGGDLEARSEVGQGSAFTVKVPHWSPEVGDEIDDTAQENTEEAPPGG